MEKYSKKVVIQTEFEGVYNLTKSIQQILDEKGAQKGLCVVTSLQPAMGLVLAPESMGRDMMSELANLVPARYNYRFQRATPTHVAGTIKAAIVGNTLSVMVEDGELSTGDQLDVLLLEFDGPRTREYLVDFLYE